MVKAEKVRCAWAESDAGMRVYHDEEWGVPERDGRALWELLMLEGFQAGLSWQIILRKREGFRRAFKREFEVWPAEWRARRLRDRVETTG